MNFLRTFPFPLCYTTPDTKGELNAAKSVTTCSYPEFVRESDQSSCLRLGRPFPTNGVLEAQESGILQQKMKEALGL